MFNRGILSFGSRKVSVDLVSLAVSDTGDVCAWLRSVDGAKCNDCAEPLTAEDKLVEEAHSNARVCVLGRDRDLRLWAVLTASIATERRQT